MKRLLVSLFLATTFGLLSGQVVPKQPVKIGIAGLSHSHVIPLLRNINTKDFKVVGIYEANRELAQRYAKEYGIDTSIIYYSLKRC